MLRYLSFTLLGGLVAGGAGPLPLPVPVPVPVVALVLLLRALVAGLVFLRTLAGGARSLGAARVL